MSFLADNFAMAIDDAKDEDRQETAEWLGALAGVINHCGVDRAHFLIEKLIEFSRISGQHLPFSANTPYINTIPVTQQPRTPGDLNIEQRIRSYTRWNALAMVLRAGKTTNVGGHIASFASAATLYDVGFNHFWRAPTEKQSGDLIYFQGHSSPGIYARAYLLGRLSEEQLDNYRQEVDGKGISSYPHPWLMPDFWQFPTVSMGLGPIMAIYQARFMRYLEARNIAHTQGRKVWAFLGDGEVDEPESLGALGLAGREHLDNLVFVINCNLQRLDGPVRGNGKIIQELESIFRGAGWNVLKVIWGSSWDNLLARDKHGILMRRMAEVVDGEYQTYKSKNGAFVREHFFNTPELKEMVAGWSDEDIWNLNRGGHDPIKIYAAYHAAQNSRGQPTVILAKTIKGYGMGESGQAMNITHQQKKMPIEALKKFRDHFGVPVKDEEIADVPYVKFTADSKELNYMRGRRESLGGYLPQRRRQASTLQVPTLAAFDGLLKESGDREYSTTMAFVRFLGTLLKDKQIGHRVVPIVPDESRTFGMEGLFRQIGIWSQDGQKYKPEDSAQLMFYKESKDGQILQEGINEAGAMCDWIAAATSYSTHNEQMIPFYIFYSMFGFQRIGDLAWAAADMRARGFLLGATAGRTTLNGEGLQHEDGHSHLFAAGIPNCMSYDPTFGYELAVIMQDGLRRMFDQQEDIFYYITLMNENYCHPAMPKGVEANILKGMYSFEKNQIQADVNKNAQQSAGKNKAKAHVQLMGSGTIFNEIMAAAKILETDWNVEVGLWSAPSFNELARDGQAITRWNRLHPEEPPRQSHVSQLLKNTKGPLIAATDYIRAFAEQIREFVPNRYVVLGTDGFGRSDTREKLRHFFEVNRYWITVAALKALADDNVIENKVVTKAMGKYGLDASKPNPISV